MKKITTLFAAVLFCALAGAETIYLTDGEGTLGAGAGTEASPYQNIRTALAAASDGDVVQLVGTVNYAKYETDTDGAAKPLVISKAITIDSDGTGSLYVRSDLMLQANVTLKDIQLQMPPEGANNGSIFLAGYTLTLDNVNTRMGSSDAQYDTRPVIRGGSYRQVSTAGTQSGLVVLNANDETRLAAIYGGDENKTWSVPMRIELGSAKLVDRTIHGGNNMTADVEVLLTANDNVTAFDKTGMTGNMNVTLGELYVGTTTINFENIDRLELKSKAAVTLDSKLNFAVGDVVLADEAQLNFYYATSQPTISGTLTAPTADGEKALLGLNNTQTLTVGGAVVGNISLNDEMLYIPTSPLVGKVYVEAAESELGNVVLKYAEGYLLEKTTADGKTQWTAAKDETVKSTVTSIKILTEIKPIIAPEWYSSEIYEIAFYDADGNEVEVFATECTTTLTNTTTGKDLSDDFFLDDDGMLNFYFWSYDIEDYYGTLKGTITHDESGVSIEVTIIVSETEVVTRVDAVRSNSAEKQYYDLQGRRMTRPSGLTIVR